MLSDVGQAGGCAESEVGAAEIGEAVGEEDDWHEEEPAAAQFARMSVWAY